MVYNEKINKFISVCGVEFDSHTEEERHLNAPCSACLKIFDGEREKQILAKFIFDESQLRQEKMFSQCRINGVFAYGLLLPKTQEIHDKKGKFVRDEQVFSPVLVSADGKLHEVSYEFEAQAKIKFPFLPATYPQRWSLQAISRFLQGVNAPVDGKSLLFDIKTAYEKYLFFTGENWYYTHSFWDMATYFFSEFQYFPLMELRGLKGTAKTKVMTMSRLFSFNAGDEWTNPSPSTLFREVAEKRISVYYDEAESLFKPVGGKLVQDERAEALNSGYKFSGGVPRQEKLGDKFHTIFYPTYSPKMLGSINGLYGATEDRAIIHIMQKAPKGDARKNREPDFSAPEWQAIRDRLYLFGLQNADLVREAYDSLQVPGLDGRELNLWKPLLAVAYVIDRAIFQQIATFAVCQAELKQISNIAEDSLEYRLLKILKQILDANSGRVLFSELKTAWLAQFGTENAPHEKTISTTLDRLGFRDFKKHFAGGNGYFLANADFEAICLTVAPSLLPEIKELSSFHSFPSLSRDKGGNEEMKQTEGNEASSS